MSRARSAVIALLVLGMGAAFVLPTGLELAARVLMVADPVVAADALYVFPGGVPTRSECAAELYRQKIAPRVVVSGERVRPELEAVGLPLSDARVNARVLARHGVPPEHVVILEDGTSTFEDADALRGWALAEPGVQRILAVTSPTHSRRARRTLRRAFRDSGIDVAVHPCPARVPPEWWRDEDSLLRVINEYIKLAYYAVAH